MQSITLTPEERKDLIVGMKRERKPSRRLRMHIVLLAADGHRPTHIAGVLYCSRTTVYTIVERFAGEGRAAFDDRQRRGPRPLLDELANERIERLVEEDSPTEHGWLRSRWSCSLLVMHLFKERALLLSRETVRRALQRLDFRWRRPRVRSRPPRIPKRSERGSKGSSRCSESTGRPSSRTRPNWRPQPQGGLLLDA